SSSLLLAFSRLGCSLKMARKYPLTLSPSPGGLGGCWADALPSTPLPFCPDFGLVLAIVVPAAQEARWGSIGRHSIGQPGAPQAAAEGSKRPGSRLLRRKQPQQLSPSDVWFVERRGAAGVSDPFA